MKTCLIVGCWGLALLSYGGERHEILPLANQEVALVIDGTETTRWHFGEHYPRPFFFPVRGPSGKSLTRMGHPGAPNHDHHRSAWFAHHDVAGVNFWSDQTEAVIRQRQWLAYEDGPDEGRLAVLLDWWDRPGGARLMEQELVVAFRAGKKADWFLELQSTFRPIRDEVVLGKTNFGFLAVRMSKEISAFFGGGQIVNNEGRKGEPALFGQPSEWIRYGKGEGITYFDHPSNPGFPSKWHVREDGWMGASVCRDGERVVTKERPLVLRYLLWMHEGGGEAGVAKAFNASPGLVVEKSEKKHTQYEVRRVE